MDTESAKKFAREFRKESDVGMNPNWPEYSGTTTWVNGDYTMTEKRLGGMNRRTRYTLFRSGEEIDWFDTEIHKGESFLKWFAAAVQGEADGTDPA